MSEYEFWDELGNIFNAIVAYQHKTIEFNKRFVNPWLRLGTVLDQNDHNSDAILAARKAIEIDQENGSNWLALGDVYFKMGSFDDAAGAYGKAIELNPKLGWAYANLALTNATRQKYTEAVNLYIKSLGLIEEDKDRSMIWNRLGNVYRKVNDYENAFIAFQMADECDGQNTGFHDQLDEVTPEQKVMPIFAEVYVNNKNQPGFASQPVVQDEPVAVDEPASETIAEPAEPEAVSSEVTEEIVPVDEVVEEAQPEAVAETSVEEPVAEEPQFEAVPGVISEEVIAEETQPEALAEISIGEPVAEETQPETEADVVSEMVVAEETQPETVAETSAEEPVVVEVQPEVEAEVVSEEVAVEEILLDAATEASVVEPVAEEAQPVAEEESVPEEVCAEDVRLEAVAETSVETPVAEEVPSDAIADVTVEMQVEVTAEIPVEEVASEDQQPGTETDGLTKEEGILVEEIQLEVISDSSDIETLSESNLPEVVTESSAKEAVNETVQAVVDGSNSEFMMADPSADTTVAFFASQGVETFADPSSLNRPVVLVVENLAELIRVSASEEDAVATHPADEAEAQHEVQTESDIEAVSPVEDAVIQAGLVEVNDDVAEVVAEIVALAGAESEETVANEDVQSETTDEEDEITMPVVETAGAQPDDVNETAPDSEVEPAYEEFLKNAVESVGVEGAHLAKNELKAEPDTKNAHVWNELGNVYFNTGAFEEAVTAYSKAIELDDWFAWPYSNLALVYVQKEKYAEAILLYQRSIELFSSDKDKAITWNRLGNVYRRLTDYDNAIACYQRADELDPNNATRSLRSRFSLLGSLNMEESHSIAG